MTNERIEKALKTLNAKQACLITEPLDIYYLTGLKLSTGALVLIPEKSFLLVDGRYIEACRQSSPVPVHLNKEGLLFEMLLGIQEVLIDGNHTSYNTYLQYEKEAHKKHLPLKVKNDPITLLRAIKDKEEIRLLKEAAELGLKGFHFVKNLLKPGITELEAAFELEYFWKKRGAQKLAFDPIIAFGANSSMPHHRASDTVLQQNDIALIDIGVTKASYHSDMTRVVFFGEVPQVLKEIHAIVQKAVETALKTLRPGVLIKDIDAAAKNVIEEAGYLDRFTHSLGHGIGLEIHEYPLIKSTLPIGNVPIEEGMAFTIEPGIYLPGIGGVRLEDTVIITKDGYENLTAEPY